MLFRADPGAIALRSDKNDGWTYSNLIHRIESLRSDLKERGVNPGHRLAIAMPNGPDFAMAIMAVAGISVALPVDPEIPRAEADRFFRNLAVDALMVPSGTESSVRRCAMLLELTVLEVMPGRDRDSGALESSDCVLRKPHGDATGLLLTTSGSTGRPKQVLLSQANLCRSAANVGNSLRLTPGDIGLCVMPLYHVHGLVAGLLAGLHAGGRVVCVPGSGGNHVADWFRDSSPTWYTASPTVHRSILDRLSPDTIKLRVVRSCSSPMPGTLLSRVESVFQCPVVEAYGMTEASHQIASNPLPPAPRKPGSVGVATGTEIVIRNENGVPVPSGDAGEITIRGDNVIHAYHSEVANDDQFHGDWLRTGDEGYLDADGYLFITGRIKETINRGGEKVRPLEIDQVLGAHPGVEIAMAFGVPHPSLGEDVVAAVVPFDGDDLKEQDLRDYAFEHLAPFKVPTRIFVVDKVPGSDIKPKRSELAEKMSHLLFTEYVAPATSTEQVVADLYTQVLGIERVGRLDNFFSLGGDSLQATLVQSKLTQRFQIDLKIGRLFERPSVAELAALIDEQAASQDAELTAALLDELDGLSEEEILRELNAPGS
jgi:acyl-CoA synthetase (AMP-forming)/AMP-acid ligase II/acyl carrier protein